MSEGAPSTGLPVTNPREAELRLWAAYGRGLLVDLRAGDPAVDDLANKDGWGESRQVRAEVVAALMLGAVDPVTGCVPGVRLAGAGGEGAVDVREGILRSGVSLTDCYFTEGLLLNEAHTHTVDLSGSALHTLDLTAAEIGGSLIL